MMQMRRTTSAPDRAGNSREPRWKRPIPARPHRSRTRRSEPRRAAHAHSSQAEGSRSRRRRTPASFSGGRTSRRQQPERTRVELLNAVVAPLVCQSAPGSLSINGATWLRQEVGPRGIRAPDRPGRPTVVADCRRLRSGRAAIHGVPDACHSGGASTVNEGAYRSPQPWRNKGRRPAHRPVDLPPRSPPALQSSDRGDGAQPRQQLRVPYAPALRHLSASSRAALARASAASTGSDSRRTPEPSLAVDAVDMTLAVSMPTSSIAPFSSVAASIALRQPAT